MQSETRSSIFMERLQDDQHLWMSDREEIAHHIAAQDAEIARLREAVKVLRDGYSDAVSGYEYIKQQHGRLDGVGFDRVTDHFFEHVTVPEREGLLAGSHWLPAIVKTETPHAK